MGNLRIEPPIGVIILGQVANYGEMTVGQLLIISKSFLFISVVSQILDFGIVLVLSSAVTINSGHIVLLILINTHDQCL